MTRIALLLLLLAVSGCVLPDSSDVYPESGDDDDSAGEAA